LAILNNDIVVPSGFLGYLSSALNAADEDVWITYPDYDRPLSAGADVTDPPTVRRTSGTWKLGGMSGFAFMLRPERHDTHGWPLIDESFEWLCGDGDLCTQMQQLGGCAARVEGLPVLHDHRRTSRNGRNTWTAAAAKRDLARSRAKYAPT
jgi:GT2 family glycosyltransferase